MVADEFPELPSVDEEKAVNFEFSAEELKRAVSQTAIASSSDATRPVLTGVLWQVYEGELYLAATDGYRLAERRLSKAEGEMSAIIPTTTLHEVVRSMTDDTESIMIYFDETQVGFKTASLEIVSRLIDGKFPDYRQLIPKSNETEVEILKSDFSRIAKISSLFARESGGGITLVASSEKELLSIHSIASELGENTSEATAKVSNDGEVTINSRYLLEVLGVVQGEELEFAFSGKLAPCVLREKTKKPDYTYIIMPMKS